jgi:hypothetical protein
MNFWRQIGGRLLLVIARTDPEWPHQRGTKRMNRVIADISPSSVSYRAVILVG